jgi:glycosyltransferase involved in cell wall biosynthesis
VTATSSGLPASPARNNLSVVLITLNEEARLAQCLGSIPRGAELIVLDSGSTDRTGEIARSFGARVEARPFTTYCEQKNAALALATRDWVLSLDADEVVSPELAQAILRVADSPAGSSAVLSAGASPGSPGGASPVSAASPPPSPASGAVAPPLCKAYRVRRQLVFMGRQLRFGKASDSPVRLIRRGRGHFESDIHERLIPQDPVATLDGDLLHYSYDDLSD